MIYEPFHGKFPKVAEEESIYIFAPKDNAFGIPEGNYLFVELYCNELKCDCRRVFLEVFSDIDESLATICWGWETMAFYQKWLGFSDKEMIKDLKGPALNTSSHQSDIAPALLKFTSEVLLKDEDYVATIKKHYLMFKKK